MISYSKLLIKFIILNMKTCGDFEYFLKDPIIIKNVFKR